MTPPTTPRGRTVIVTGGSAGVGRAVAARFARAGDRVGLIARDAEALAEVVADLEALGATAAAEAADVADAAAVFEAAGRLEMALGPADLWINAAMATVFSPFWEMAPEEYRRVTETTYLGFVHGTMAALRSMRPRGRGRILQIGSALGYRGIPLQSAYCGAKHAIKGFTEAVRTELLHEGLGISIALIDLPAVNTPQFDWARAKIPHQPRPMGRPVQPEAVADAVFRAADGRWREYWLGRTTAETVLGEAAWPGFLDRFLARRAVDGQQTGAPLQPDRPDNLFHPVGPPHRTRGSFSAEAAERVMSIPAPLATLGVVCAGALAFLLLGAGTAALLADPRR